MSIGEILLIIIVALLVLKPEQLPNVAYSLGRWLAWCKKTMSAITNDIKTSLKHHE